VSGDGLVRPVNAPSGQSTAIGVPGVQQAVVIANTVIVFGPGTSGVFVYSGTPGPGNPPIASMTNSSTDPFGNAVLPGVQATGGTFSAQLIGGQLRLFDGAAGITALSTADGVVLNVGLGSPVVIPGLVAIEPGTAGTPETWHAMTPLNGWVNNASFAAAQYRLTASPPDTVEVIGVMVATAASNVIFAQLPPGYRPASAQGFAAGSNAGGIAGETPNIRCDTSGNLSVDNATVPATAAFIFHGFIALDA
jgi:hypothetical protein